MAKTFTVPYPQTCNNIDGTIVAADTTSKKTVFTAGANDSVIKSFGLTNSDSGAHIVHVYVNVGGGGTDRLIGTVNVLGSGGSDGTTPALDVMRSTIIPFFALDAYGNSTVTLKASSTIKIASGSTLSGGSIDAFGEGADY